MGCDSSKSIILTPQRVSIHAPVWGATNSPDPLLGTVGFNPRTRVGCDKTRIQIVILLLFQSTHPCGVRPLPMLRLTLLKLFQSTHPCGVRRVPTAKYMALILFQSTHPCGVRQRQDNKNTAIHCFNPRTRVGCDSQLDDNPS